ncbi:MAG: hypothetical protein ABSB22_06720 [Thermodesulfobacteriota bacterium]|jgi:hypothetical protein
MKSKWQFYERAQKEVYRKLKAREKPEAVVGAGWGLLGHFFIFLLVWVSLHGSIFVPSE